MEKKHLNPLKAGRYGISVVLTLALALFSVGFLVFINSPSLSGMSVSSPENIVGGVSKELIIIDPAELGVGNPEGDLPDEGVFLSKYSLREKSNFESLDVVGTSDTRRRAIKVHSAIGDSRYALTVFPSESVVRSVDFKDLRVEDEALSLGVEDGVVSSSVQSYAIDPTSLDFGEANVSVIARGDVLFKCASWNFSTSECYEERICDGAIDERGNPECRIVGGWKKIMELEPGKEYSFIITTDDPAFAEYDSGFTAPYCSSGESPCIADSSLLRSRDSLGTSEPNQPNTIDSCSDGTSGSYQSDESAENITVRSLNGSYIRAGDTVEVTGSFYCWNDANDNLNFVYTSNASSPSWSVKAFTDPCPTAGFYTVSHTWVLDGVAGDHAVRTSIQYNGNTATTCGSGNYDDNDDLVFKVLGPQTPPEVSDLRPVANSSYDPNESVVISAKVFDTDGLSYVNASIVLPDGSFEQVSLSPDVIGETMTLFEINGSWQTVSFANSYDDPVVFASPLTVSDDRPAEVRIKDVTSSGFSVRAQEPTGDYPDTDDHGLENISVIVFETGIHQLSNGETIEVHKMNLSTTTSGIGASNYDTINYNISWSSTPVVLSQVQTYEDSMFVSTAKRNVGASSFQLALEVAQDDAGPHGSEVVAWMVINETGSSANSVIDGIRYSSVITADSIKGHDNGCYAAPHGLGEVPSGVVGMMMKRDGGNGGWARYCNNDNEWTSTNTYWEIDEVDNGERSHATELVGFIVFNASGDIIDPRIWSGFFNSTSQGGRYDVTILAEDVGFSLNDSETTYFNVIIPNTPPSVPIIIAPSQSSVVDGLFNITWQQVNDSEDDNLVFFIDLLDENGTFVQSIVSGLPDFPSPLTSYEWNSSSISDGRYLIRLNVSENDTVEKYSSAYTMLGVFNLNNLFPVVSAALPSAGSDYLMSDTVSLGVDASDFFSLDVFANITLPDLSVERVNLSLISGDSYVANFTSTIQDGNYSADFFSIDEFGKTSNISTWFYVDALGPEISSPSPLGDSFNVSSEVNISVFADDYGGVASVYAEITRPSGNVDNLSLSDGNLDGTFDALYDNILERGRYNISFVAIDANGFFSVTQSYFFRITPPITGGSFDVVDENLRYHDFNVSVLSNSSGILTLELEIVHPSIDLIVVEGFDESSYDSVLVISNKTSESADLFVDTWAVDPSNLNHSKVNITFTAVGNYLFKCSEFNITSGICLDDENYTQIMTDMVIGNQYTVTIHGIDPGFGETIAGPENVSDAYFRSGAVGSNYGGSTRIRVGRNTAGNVIRGVVWFNFSLPSGVRIDDALLRMYLYSIPSGDATASRSHGVHKVQQSPVREWVEDEVTWNDYRSGQSWTSAGGDFSSTATDTVTFSSAQLNSWLVWNVTPDVSDFYENGSNYGWVVKDTSETVNKYRVDYHSTEYSDSSYWPELLINYSDMTLPSVVLVAPSLGVSYNQEDVVRIVANVSDNLGVDSVRANVSFGVFSSVLSLIHNSSSGLYEADFNSTSYVSVSPERYNITILANDSSGLLNDSVNGYFNVSDVSAPSLSISSPSTGLVFNPGNLVTFNISSSDPYWDNVDVVRVEVTNTTGDVTEIILVEDGNTQQFIGVFSSTSEFGRYNFTAYSNDTSGNTPSSVSDYFLVEDTIDPSVSIVLPSDGTAFNQTAVVQFSVNVTDNVGVDSVHVNVSWDSNSSLVELSFDSGSGFYNGTFSSTYYVLVSPERYDFRVISNDTSGNVDSSETGFFNVSDVTAPNVVRVSPDFGYLLPVNGSVLVSANVSDPYWDNIAIVQANITKPNGSSSVVSLLDGDFDGVYSATYSDTGVVGRYNLTYLAEDNAGNVNDSRSSFFEVRVPSSQSSGFVCAVTETPYVAEAGEQVLIQADIRDRLGNLAVASNLSVISVNILEVGGVGTSVGGGSMTYISSGTWFYEFDSSPWHNGNYIAYVSAVTNEVPQANLSCASSFSISGRSLFDVQGISPDVINLNTSARLAVQVLLNSESISFSDIQDATLNITMINGTNQTFTYSSLNTVDGLVYADGFFDTVGAYFLDWKITYFNRTKSVSEVVVVVDFDNLFSTSIVGNFTELTVLADENREYLEEVVEKIERSQAFSEESVFLITDAVNSVTKTSQDIVEGNVSLGVSEKSLSSADLGNISSRLTLISGKSVTDVNSSIVSCEGKGIFCWWYWLVFVAIAIVIFGYAGRSLDFSGNHIRRIDLIRSGVSKHQEVLDRWKVPLKKDYVKSAKRSNMKKSSKIFGGKSPSYSGMADDLESGGFSVKLAREKKKTLFEMLRPAPLMKHGSFYYEKISESNFLEKSKAPKEEIISHFEKGKIAEDLPLSDDEKSARDRELHRLMSIKRSTAKEILESKKARGCAYDISFNCAPKKSDFISLSKRRGLFKKILSSFKLPKMKSIKKGEVLKDIKEVYDDK